jgi:hypothetical protein
MGWGIGVWEGRDSGARADCSDTTIRPRWALISRVSGGRRERTSRSPDNSGYKRKNMENKEKRRNKKKN